MSLLDAYADTIGAAYDHQLRNPPPAPEQSFGTMSALAAGMRGVPAAALEVTGSALDAVSGFGNVLSASGGSAGGMFSVPTEAEQKQEAAARERMLRSDNASVELGNVLRRKADEFAPDPLTTHTADQVLHGLVRFGGKAVGAVGLLGPVAGPLALGVEEANTVTQKLRAEGVDTATAAKVGAVQGGMAAAGAVLPLAGKTIMQTLGLVAVGGPGSYVAQEALSRKILEEAGYNDQASLHNPFDPLGLAISTVIPGGFGAFHGVRLRQRAKAVEAGTVPLGQLRPEELRALKYDDPRLDEAAVRAAERHGVPPALLLAIKNAGEKSGPTATSPKGARGIMQFMPATAKEMGLADPTDPLASLDAGARYLRKLFDAYGSWGAAVAHYNGGGAQAAIVRGGGQPTAKETLGYLRRVREYVAEHTAQQAAKDPAAVDAARVVALNDTVARSLPDTPDALAQVQRAADIVAEQGGRAAEAEIPPARPEAPSIIFEVAPDPNNLELVSRWRALPEQSRQEISQRISDEIVPKVLEGHGVSGRITGQIGSYLEDTNPSFALRYDASADPVALAKEIGYVFQQDSVVVMSPDRFDGAEGTGAVAIDVGNLPVKQIDELYKRLHALEVDGQNPIGGQSTIDGRMVVLNFSDVPTARLAQAIDQALEGKYTVSTRDIYAAFPEKKDYGHASQTDDGRGSQDAVRRRPDSLRQEAGAALQRELDAALSRGRSTEPGAAGADPAAGGARPDQLAAAARARESTGNALPDADSVTLDPPSGSAPRETEAGATASLDAMIAKKLATEKPEMQVILPGTDEKISVSEALARIEEDKKLDTQWGDLVKVAAECALGG